MKIGFYARLHCMNIFSIKSVVDGVITEHFLNGTEHQKSSKLHDSEKPSIPCFCKFRNRNLGHIQNDELSL